MQDFEGQRFSELMCNVLLSISAVSIFYGTRDPSLTNPGSGINYGLSAARHLFDAVGWSRRNAIDHVCCCPTMAVL